MFIPNSEHTGPPKPVRLESPEHGSCFDSSPDQDFLHHCLDLQCWPQQSCSDKLSNDAFIYRGASRDTHHPLDVEPSSKGNPCGDETKIHSKSEPSLRPVGKPPSPVVSAF
ncbi:hypothetical protein H2248_004017 [Termitomyces sp. 'cryptogamus']|nr:hypothetical protein H2248_004017 [Termitomyces sp. 'cryptogamus']